MKKKFLTLLLAICLILPCAFILSACGEKAKFNVNINTFVGYTAGSLKEGVEEIRLVNASNYNSNVYTDFPVISKDIGKEVTKFEVEEGSKLILFMVLEPGYEINNVKIKPDGYNGTAISPEVFDNYDASGSWVYAFNLTSSLNKELWVVFEGAPARRMQTISLAQTNAQYFDQLKPGSGEDVDPASKVLENARLSLTSKIGAHTQNCFSNISITEFREKIHSNETFEVPAGSTLTLKAYTGFEDSDGNIRIINLYQANIYDTLSYTQSFSSDSSFLETVCYENETITFDWTKFTSESFISSIDFIIYIYENGGNNTGKYISSVKASNGTVLLDREDDFSVSFKEYFNNYNSGIKIETPITKAEYTLLADSASELTINYQTRYTVADAIAQGIISVDNEENPNFLTITITAVQPQDSGLFFFEFVYYKDSLQNNPNLKQIELQVDIENGEEGPYEIARYFQNDEADGTIAALIETYDTTDFDPNDCTNPISCSGYYYKDTTIRVVADVAFTTEKTYGWENSGVYENKTFKLIINEVEITFAAVDIEPEEDYTHYQWKIEGTAPTWLVLSDAYNDYQSKIDFTIDTEAFSEATGQDLALIKIDM